MSNYSLPTLHNVQGAATFTGPHTVSVDGVEYEGEHILIAVGGTPTLPNIPGADMCDTSDQFFEWETLPEKVLVVGAGYIAVEIAGERGFFIVKLHFRYKAVHDSCFVTQSKFRMMVSRIG